MAATSSSFSQAPTQKLNQDEDEAWSQNQQGVQFTQGALNALGANHPAVKNRSRIEIRPSPAENSSPDDALPSRKSSSLTQEDLRFSSQDLRALQAKTNVFRAPRSKPANENVSAVDSETFVTSSQLQAAKALEGLKEGDDEGLLATQLDDVNDNHPMEIVSPKSKGPVVNQQISQTQALGVDEEEFETTLQRQQSIIQGENNVRVSDVVTQVESPQLESEAKEGAVTFIHGSRILALPATKSSSKAPLTPSQVAEFAFKATQRDNDDEDEDDEEAGPVKVRGKVRKPNFTDDSPVKQPPPDIPKDRIVVTEIIANELYKHCFPIMRSSLGWTYKPGTTADYTFLAPGVHQKSKGIRGETLFEGHIELFQFMLDNRREELYEIYPEFSLFQREKEEKPVPSKGSSKKSKKKSTESESKNAKKSTTVQEAPRLSKEEIQAKKYADLLRWEREYITFYNHAIRRIKALGWSIKAAGGLGDYKFIDPDQEAYLDVQLVKGISRKYPDLFREIIDEIDPPEEDKPTAVKAPKKDKNSKSSAKKANQKNSVKKNVVAAPKPVIEPKRLEDLLSFGRLQSFLVNERGWTWQYKSSARGDSATYYLPGRENAEDAKKHVDYFTSELEVYDYCTKNPSWLEGLEDNYGRDLSKIELLASSYTKLNVFSPIHRQARQVANDDSEDVQSKPSRNETIPPKNPTKKTTDSASSTSIRADSKPKAKKQEIEKPRARLEDIVSFGRLLSHLRMQGWDWRYSGTAEHYFLPMKKNQPDARKHVDYFSGQLEVYHYCTKNPVWLKDLEDKSGREVLSFDLLPSSYVERFSPDRQRKTSIEDSMFENSNKLAKEESKEASSSESEGEEEEQDEEDREEINGQVAAKANSPRVSASSSKGRSPAFLKPDAAEKPFEHARKEAFERKSTHSSNDIHDVDTNVAQPSKRPRLDATPMVFQGLSFSLTGVELAKPNAPNEYLQLANIKGLMDLIEEHGGIVVHSFGFDSKHKLPDFVISKPGAYRTEKSLTAWVQEIPVLHPQYILDCVRVGVKLEIDKYRLPKALLLPLDEYSRPVPQPYSIRFEYTPSSTFDFRMPKGVLRGKQVKIISSLPFWTQLARYMGADCLEPDDLPTRSTYVVASMEDYDPATLAAIDRVRSLRLDVFTFEWLVQMILHGKFIDPQQHPQHVRFLRRDPVLKDTYERSPDAPNSREMAPLGKPLDSGSIIALRVEQKRYEIGDYVILRQSGVGFNDISNMAELDERRVRFARIREVFPIPDSTVFRLVVDLLTLREGSHFHLKTTCEKLELPLDTIVTKITCVYVPEHMGGETMCDRMGSRLYEPISSRRVDFRDRLYFLSYEPV